MTTEATTQPTIMDVLRIRNFRWLWMGQVVSDFGDALTALAAILLINRVTDGSTSAIAGLLIAFALPKATLGLAAGVFVDRLNRKQVMLISDLLRGCLTLMLLFLDLETGSNLWLLYVIVLLHATVGSFFTPAKTAIIPNVVPKESLLSANSLSQISSVLFRVLGTAAAGFMIGTFETFWLIFLFDALTFFLSALCIRQIQLDERVAQTGEGSMEQTATELTFASVYNELREGVSLMFQNRILFGILVGGGMAMLGLGATNVLLAPFVVNDLGVSEIWFGAIEFGQTSAMIISGALVAVLAARIKAVNLIGLGLLGIGMMVMTLNLVQTVWHLIPILFVVGLFVVPLQSAIATLMQTTVSDEIRGRVASAMDAVIQSATLLSFFAAGATATIIGTRNVFALSGAITLVAGCAAWWILKGGTTAEAEQTPLPVETGESLSPQTDPVTMPLVNEQRE